MSEVGVHKCIVCGEMIDYDDFCVIRGIEGKICNECYKEALTEISCVISRLSEEKNEDFLSKFVRWIEVNEKYKDNVDVIWYKGGMMIDLRVDSLAELCSLATSYMFEIKDHERDVFKKILSNLEIGPDYNDGHYCTLKMPEKGE